MPQAYQDEHHHAQALDSSIVPATKGNRYQNSRAYLMAFIGFMGIFLFGYDTGLGGGVLALPTFQSEFGLIDDKGVAVPNLSALQGNIVSVLQGGAFFGAIFGAPIEDKLGRKIGLMIGCGVFIIGGVIQTACFGSLDQFYVGRVIAGVGVGLMSMICPTYASEIAPKEIRGRITGLFQIVVVVGVAFSFWINYGVSFMTAADGAKQWRIPIGFQIVPVGIMMILLPFLKESPRWLATKHQEEKALENLAWIRKVSVNDQNLQLEFAEIQAAIREEEEQTKGASWREIFAKGNPVRFVIAFVVFTLQQWSGQNSISYYAPIIFKAIGITGSHTSLLASGIYGIVKIVATSVFIAFGVERFGRKLPLQVGVLLMSICLWIIGAIMFTHVVYSETTHTWGIPVTGTTAPSSIGMAVMIYLFVIPYCFSVGPLPWVVCSEIFNNRTRHYGLMTAAATQWLHNFAVSMATPTMVTKLDKGGIFFFFATINIISLVLTTLFLPETKGISLEAMDVLFGSTTAEEREQAILNRAKINHVEEKQEVGHVEDSKRSTDQIV